NHHRQQDDGDAIVADHGVEQVQQRGHRPSDKAEPAVDDAVAQIVMRQQVGPLGTGENLKSLLQRVLFSRGDDVLARDELKRDGRAGLFQRIGWLDRTGNSFTKDVVFRVVVRVVRVVDGVGKQCRHKVLGVYAGVPKLR